MKKYIKWLIITLFWILTPLLVLPCTVYGWFWDNTWVPLIELPWTSENQEDSLLHTVRVATNRVLGMLSFAALMLCLYAGFIMMTSSGDQKKYGDWLKILKNAGIWLDIIWGSWLIVSLVFRIINQSIQLK